MLDSLAVSTTLLVVIDVSIVFRCCFCLQVLLLYWRVQHQLAAGDNVTAMPNKSKSSLPGPLACCPATAGCFPANGFCSFALSLLAFLIVNR